MEVGNCNSCSKYGVVGVGNSHVCGSLGGLGEVSGVQDAFGRVIAFAELETHKIVKLDGCDTLVDT